MRRDLPVAVVIPARDEARRIGACLDALSVAIARADRPVLAVVVVNDTTDATAAVARAAMPGALVLDPPGAPGVGVARALGLAAARDRLGADLTLMTTDADSQVDPDWIAANLRSLMRADVVFGAVRPDADEMAALGPFRAAGGADEGRYFAACVAAEAALDPGPHAPETAHRNPAGASIAVAAAALDRLGGLPPLREGEDRALARAAAAADLRVAYAAGPVVTTSCRITGRTPGGMAGALRARLAETDPLCDDWLEPAAAFWHRVTARAAARAAWGADRPGFGAAWAAREAADPALARVRLRQSQAGAELATLTALCAARPLTLEGTP